jgi:hypothetical protein
MARLSRDGLLVWLRLAGVGCFVWACLRLLGLAGSLFCLWTGLGLRVGLSCAGPGGWIELVCGALGCGV